MTGLAPLSPIFITILEVLASRPLGMTTGQVLGQVLAVHEGTTRVEVWNTLTRLRQRDMVLDVSENEWRFNFAKPVPVKPVIFF